MIPGIQEIKALAIKYSKKQLANMAQTGLIDPQKAVMAGMMRDRIAKEDMQPPTTTVAQDVLGMGPQAQPQMGMQPQMGQPQGQPQPQMPPPQMGAPMGQPPVMAASGGLTDLPVDVQDYAGGGIVAFDDGGAVPGYAGDRGSLVYGGSFEDLPVYVPRKRPNLQPAGSMGEVFSNLGSAIANPVVDFFSNAPDMNRAARQMVGKPDQGGPRADPVTGEPLSLGEFLRRQEAERGAVAPTTTPTADTATRTPPAPPRRDAAPRAQGPGTSTPSAPSVSALKRPEYALPDVSGLKPEEFKTRGARELPAIGKERMDYMRSMGIDPDLYGKMIEKEEGKRKDLQGRKDVAKGEALMEVGLGLIGARRGQEFQALGEAGRRGLGSLREAGKELRAAEEKLDDRINSFRLADQQAKQTGAEKDIAERNADLARVEAAQRDAVKERNSFALKRTEYELEGKKTQYQGAVSMYGNDLQKELGEKQLKLKEKEIANQAAYYKNSLAITEKRIQAMDRASQAKFMQMKLNAEKLLQNDQGYMDLQGQLRQKYKDAWTTNPESQRMMQNYKDAFIGNVLDTQGALIGGVPDATNLLQQP